MLCCLVTIHKHISRHVQAGLHGNFAGLFCEHVAVQAASLVTFPHRWQYKCRTFEVETVPRNCMSECFCFSVW